MNNADAIRVTKPVVDLGSPSNEYARFSRSRRPAKILDSHLDREALVYIRQSTPQQVVNNRESRERQYALVDLAIAYGWPRDRIQVVDDDQGQSGKTAEHRSGFHRVLAEVTMEHVGLVLGIEMSRFARSNKEWHTLLEMCAIVHVLLADEDGVYDPEDSNDRLLLGLKGTISEFELVTMRNRLERARLHKAERGALFQNVPMGYVKVSSEQIAIDPDEQVRHVVRLIFDKYDELGTVKKVYRYLTRNNILLGMRPFHGLNRGQLEWRPPTAGAVRRVIRNPLYAGAYTYGLLKPKRGGPGSRGSVSAEKRDPSEEWKVLKRDSVPAYITWDQHLLNIERLRQNCSLPDTQGPARNGHALLTGLVICGQCGCRLAAAYRGRKRVYYSCIRHRREGTEQTCRGLSAAVLDDLLREQVLRALEPAGLELSCRVREDLQRDHARLDKDWRLRLERAGHESRDAERRYRAVDPENRLVARTLEQGWEEALRRERRLHDDHDRFLRQQPTSLTAEDQARITAISADLPGLWHAASTTPQDHKEIIRHVVERVVVHVKLNSEYVDVEIHWQGGFTSQHEIVRPVGSYKQMQAFSGFWDRVMKLRSEGRTAAEIATHLNQEGFTTPKHRGPFTADVVLKLLSRRGLATKSKSIEALGPHEWRLSTLAAQIPVSAGKLADWARRGWLHSRRGRAQRMWIVWADKHEMKRLRKLAAASHRGCVEYPPELTKPIERNS